MAPGSREPMTAGMSRRQMLQHVANGFGMVGLAGLLAEA